MSEHIQKIDIPKWVDRAKVDNATYLQRQATEVILHAIAMEPSMKEWLYLKGGILMGLVYDSPRQTSDIDFSFKSTVSPDKNIVVTLEKLINPALKRAATKLGYVDMVMRFQSFRERPRKKYPNASFPALKIKIGYARRHSHQEKMLRKGKANNVISIDISFKEEINEFQVLKITDGELLLAYSLTDLIAEKYRAVLQQIKRKRNRRQDVYDLHILIQKIECSEETKTTFLKALIKKCGSRGVIPNRTSIDNPEIKERLRSEWSTMQLEIGELPNFDVCFDRVAAFYRQLPWADLS